MHRRLRHKSDSVKVDPTGSVPGVPRALFNGASFPKKFAQAACAASRVMWQIYAVRGAYLSAKRGHIWRVSSASGKKLGGVSKAFQFGASQLVSLIDFPHRFSAWGFGNKIDVLKRFILLSRYTNIAMVVNNYPKNQRINSISCHRPWSVPQQDNIPHTRFHFRFPRNRFQLC